MLINRGTLLLILLLFSLQCKKALSEKEEDEQILAKVGSWVITIDEFRNNYEYGFAHLKPINNSKKHYLKYMINEKLLAIDGYENGLDKRDNIQTKKQILMDELLIEHLIEEKIKANIAVTSDEIIEAINKSKVEFNIRYWVEETREKAHQAKLEIDQRGFSEFIDEYNVQNSLFTLESDQFETGYVSWETIPDIFLNEVKGLAIDKISEPSEIDGNYWIFQVMDIRRSGILDSEYNSKSASFRKILYHQKLQEGIVDYVEALMMPKEIVTKSKSLIIIADAYWEWTQYESLHTIDFLEFLKSGSKRNSFVRTLNEKSESPMIQHSEGTISINEFIHSFNFGRLKTKYDSLKELRNDLNMEIAKHLRDGYLIQDAVKLGINESPKLIRELSLWMDKWVYEDIRAELANGQKVNRQTMHERLENRLSDLRKIHPVVIYENKLDSIKVVQSSKSRWLTVHAYKTGSWRMTHPIADPFWGWK